jgi:hypothetical protein
MAQSHEVQCGQLVSAHSEEWWDRQETGRLVKEASALLCDVMYMAYLARGLLLTNYFSSDSSDLRTKFTG